MLTVVADDGPGWGADADQLGWGPSLAHTPPYKEK